MTRREREATRADRVQRQIYRKRLIARRLTFDRCAMVLEDLRTDSDRAAVLAALGAIYPEVLEHWKANGR